MFFLFPIPRSFPNHFFSFTTPIPTPLTHFQDNFAHPDLNWGPVVSDNQCGVSAVRRSFAQRRIVGGDEAGFGTFPWQAYIRIGTSRCGGSLGKLNIHSSIPSSLSPPFFG